MVSRLGIYSQISEIKDFLYLSGVTPVRSDILRSRKITSVVNATIDEPCMYMAGIDYLKVRVDDSPHVHIDVYFDMVADRIRSVKENGGKILVHCVAGVSRSATLVIAYMMKYERLCLRDAYHRVKAGRPVIRPNNGFWKQLIDYERRLFGKATVRMVEPRAGLEEVPDVYATELRTLNGFATLSISRPLTSRRALVERVGRRNPLPMVRSTSLFTPLSQSTYSSWKPEYSSLNSGLWK